MNYPILILSVILLLCMFFFLTVPVFADEVSEPSTMEPETVPESTPEMVYVEVIQDIGSAIVHADLFGAFLICGTLVGIFLLRGRYGT